MPAVTNEEYLKRATQEVERAKRKLPQFAGECAACRWSKGDRYWRICEHPAVVCAAFNMSDAYARERIQTCDEQRDVESVWGPVLCGPNGALYEEAVEVRRPSWFERLLGGSE